jgi:hypothetical protein
VVLAVAIAIPVQQMAPAGVVTARPRGVKLTYPASRPDLSQDTVSRTNLRARNEKAIINSCLDYVEAQLNYFRSDQDADGFLAFAERIRSTPGRHDGLYWAIGADDDESPMGPNFAAAAITEQEASDDIRPFFGYYFKMLLSQGPEAVGGARDYRIDGRLVAGFALVAWPADYGTSGVRSFLVNHLGDVYAKDLGPETPRSASAMTEFSPDWTWTKAASAADHR